MRKSSIFTIAFLLIIALFSIIYWSDIKKGTYNLINPINEKESYKQIKLAEEYLKQGKPKKALKIIRNHSREISKKTALGKKWIELFIQASVEREDLLQLTTLYSYYPQAFENDEKAVTLVCLGLLKYGRIDEFKSLRDRWKNKQTLTDDWFLVDAEYLAQTGDEDAAIKMLESRSFEGKQDSQRLVRLAILTMRKNPKRAWEYLSLAYKKDKQNPMIRIYRARLLELGKRHKQATREYLAAIALEPDAPYFRDQLAEHFRRNREFLQALNIWSLSLDNLADDDIWVKAIFWSKVIAPIHFNFKDHPIPPGNHHEYIKYLLELKPDEYWNEKIFKRYVSGKKVLLKNQSSIWLKTLEALKEGKEIKAYELLKYNPFKEYSWDRKLEEGLERILLYRLQGKLKLEREKGFKNVTMPQDQQIDFFKKLKILGQKQYQDENFKIPKEIDTLLKSPDAFAAAFLAAGWFKAGVDFNKSQIIPPSYPKWYTISLAKAIQINKGNKEAIAFLEKQNQTPLLQLLTAKILLAEGKLDKSIEKLLPLTKKEDEISKKASYIASIAYLKKGDSEKAKEIILSHPNLSTSILGKEMLARIFLFQENEKEAVAIYESIIDTSTEAQSFLARKAFLEGDYKKAKALTENLIKTYPKNRALRENLKLIESKIEEKNNKTLEKEKLLPLSDLKDKKPLKENLKEKQQEIKKEILHEKI